MAILPKICKVYFSYNLNSHLEINETTLFLSYFIFDLFFLKKSTIITHGVKFLEWWGSISGSSIIKNVWSKLKLICDSTSYTATIQCFEVLTINIWDRRTSRDGSKKIVVGLNKLHQYKPNLQSHILWIYEKKISESLEGSPLSRGR